MGKKIFKVTGAFISGVLTMALVAGIVFFTVKEMNVVTFIGGVTLLVFAFYVYMDKVISQVLK